MRRSTTTPDEYLASLPDDIREELRTLDGVISEVMAGRDRVLWEGAFWGGTEQRIIGYGSYRSVGRSGAEVDWFVVGLARQKHHLSVYVNAVEDGRYLVQRYADRLGKVKVGSANVAIKRVADIDMAAFREMLEQAARSPLPGS
jgi:hypothetical protein